jgi:hypothetical protein
MKSLEEIGRDFDTVFVPKMDELRERHGDMLSDLVHLAGPDDAQIIFAKYRASYVGGYLAARKEILGV